MRSWALALVVLASVNVAHADTAFKVGVTTRDYIPGGSYDWRGAKTRALHAMIWYPAAADAREEPQWVGPSVIPLSSAGSAARDAPPAAGPRRPLVLLSHGFGGAATDLAWFGTALAAHGFIAAAVNHPGNNAAEDYTVEGFSLMWLRANDLSAALDAMLADRTFADHIDVGRVAAAGHSLGGYSVIAIAGGISDPAHMAAFCRSPQADVLCKPSAQIADLRQRGLARLATDADYRRRYGEAGNSRRDARVRAAFAMAPGLVPIFTPESLANITIPVAIVSGDADAVVPLASGAEVLMQSLPHATIKLFPRAGHFVFSGTCTWVGRLVLRGTCRDRYSDRDAVHAETIRLALEFFATNLR